MKTERLFDGMTNRYAFDFKHCTIKNGYAQVDTSQDAPYYGTWANPFKLQVVTYAEGDITIRTAENAAEFADEIETMKDWNLRIGLKFYGIDPGFNEPLANQFKTVGLGHLLH